MTGVTANTASRKHRICSQPLVVMVQNFSGRSIASTRYPSMAMLTTNPTAESRLTVTSLHQPVAGGDVADGDEEEQEREDDERDVQHGSPRERLAKLHEIVNEDVEGAQLLRARPRQLH